MELAALPPDVQAALHEILLEVDGLHRPVMREVNPAIDAAQAALAAELEEWLADVEGEQEFGGADLARGLRTVREAQESIEYLDVVIYGALLGALPRSGAAAVSHVRRVSAALPLDVEAADLAAYETLLERYSRYKYSAALLFDIRRELVRARTRGETFNQMTSRIAKIRVDAEGAAGPMARALFNKYWGWANNVVRTEVMHAYNAQADEAIQLAAQLDGEIMKRWDATLDYRLCPTCAELHGTVVNVNESFPQGFDYPPAHNNCRCVVVAWRDDWEI